VLQTVFTPANWYWIAANGRIYSSARSAIVYPEDAGYRAFIAVHGAVTPWPVDGNGNQTADALKELLAHYGIVASIP
jgi:hypothetical protein